MADWRGQSCAVCGGALARELLRINEPDRFERHVGIAKEGYARHWVECEGCGVATNVQAPENRRRLEAIAAGYYEVDLAGSSVAEKYAKIMALPAEKSDNVQRVVRIHAFLHTQGSNAGRVLDIGAGTGVFLSRFLAAKEGAGWKGVGVEPDPAAAAHLRSLGRFEVIEGLFSPALGLGGFDLVTLNKVVEHLPQPLALVRDAGGALQIRRGVLYLELPDKLTASERAPSDNILGALHCHLYDSSSIVTLLERAGLRPLHVEQVFEPSGKITVAAFAGARR
jgi:SAM-dependent methyltransferase